MSVALSFVAPARPVTLQELNDQDLLRYVLSFLLPSEATAKASSRLILEKQTIAAVVNAPVTDLNSGGFGLSAGAAKALAAIGTASSAITRIATNRSRKTHDMQTSKQLAGNWLKSLREGVGLTQRDLANSIGSQCYTMVDQIESGVGKVTWHAVPAWAEALQVPPAELARSLMRFYEPELYAMVYSDTSEPAARRTPGTL